VTKANGEEVIIDEEQVAAKQRVYLIGGLATVAACAFFVGLGDLALLGPDEPRYAEVAREMFASGDYISPRLCGCLWFEKPVLLYWLGSAAYHVFGVNEFAARLPSALAALTTMLLLFRALRLIVSVRLAASAAVVFATSGIVIGYARSATPDMLLAASMSVALLSLFRWTRASGRKRLAHVALFASAAGLAMLAKGLVALILIGAIVVAFLTATGLWRTIWPREWSLALVIGSAVASLWYAPVVARHGWGFIEEFFVKHHIERYTTNVYGHPQPVYFYLFVAAAGVLPWSFFLVPAATRLRTLRPRTTAKDALLLLAWIWLAVPTLFFSFSVSKLPGYLLPVFPALAIIVGFEVERFWSGDRSRVMKFAGLMTAAALLALGAGFVVYLKREAVPVVGWRNALLIGPLVAAVVVACALAVSRRRLFICSTVVTVVLVAIAGVTLLFPKASAEWTLKTLSLRAAAELRPGERIAFFIVKEFAPVFYAEGRVVCGEGTVLNALREDILAEALENEPSLLVFTLTRWQGSLEGDPRFATELIGEQGDALVYRVRLRR